MLNKYWKIGIIIIVASLLISCGATPKNKLVGKWVDEGQAQSGDYMEFRNDNTVVMSTKAVPTPLEGTWSLTDTGDIKVDLTIAASVKQSILFQFDDDGKLTSTGPNGVKNSMIKL